MAPDPGQLGAEPPWLAEKDREKVWKNKPKVLNQVESGLLSGGTQSDPGNQRLPSCYPFTDNIPLLSPKLTVCGHIQKGTLIHMVCVSTYVCVCGRGHIGTYRSPYTCRAQFVQQVPVLAILGTHERVHLA